MISGKVILISTDEGLVRDIRDALGSAVNLNQFQILQEPQKALESITAEKEVGLIIIDWDSNKPKEISNFLQKFKKIRKAKPIPFMFVASNPSPSTIAMSMEYEAQQILMRQGLKAHLKHALTNFVSQNSDANYFQSLIDDLEISIKSKNTKAVDQALATLQQKFPKNPRVLAELGHHHLRTGRHAEAATIAQELLNLIPNDIRAISLMARVKLHTKNFDEAIALMEKCETLSPGNASRLVLFGEIHWSKGQHAIARQKYEEALNIEPNMPEAQQGLALVSASLGDEAAALSILAHALNAEEIGAFFNNAGILASHRGRFDEAVKLYESASRELDLPELKAKVLFNIGLAHERAGRTNLAQAAFNAAKELAPNLEKAQAHLLHIDKPTE